MFSDKDKSQLFPHFLSGVYLCQSVAKYKIIGSELKVRLKKNQPRINAVRRINPNKIRIIGVYLRLKNWICQHSLTFSSLLKFVLYGIFYTLLQ